MAIYHLILTPVSPARTLSGTERRLRDEQSQKADDNRVPDPAVLHSDSYGFLRLGLVGEVDNMRQRVLDEYHPRSVRVLVVYQHGNIAYVGEDAFKRERGK